MTIEDLYSLIGSGVCHQLPERSYELSGHHLPLCIRCSGIYLGYLTGRLSYLTTPKVSAFPAIWWWLAVLAGIVLSIVEFMNEFAFQNILWDGYRLIGGFLIGIGFACLIIPVFRRKKAGWPEVVADTVRTNLSRLIIIISVFIILLMFIYIMSYLPWWLVATLEIIGLILVVFDLSGLVGLGLGIKGRALYIWSIIITFDYFLFMAYIRRLGVF
jgi:uncharacterized membrane protein